MNTSFLIPMLLSLSGFVFSSGGGSNDLLDFVQTSAYWNAKDVSPSLEQLIGDVKPARARDISADVAALGSENATEREAATKKIGAMGAEVIPQLRETASADPEVAHRAEDLINHIAVSSKPAAVRKLMAIRTLGEMKKPAALPALKALLSSDEPFVADYARAAIASIEGKEVIRPRPTPAQRMEDVNLLPAQVLGVANIALGGKATRVEDLLKQVPLPQGASPDEAMQQATGTLLPIVEKIGNARVDSLTVGFLGSSAQTSGAFVVVLRGKYDHLAAQQALIAAGTAPAEENGVTAFHVLDGPAAPLVAIFPSDERAIIMVPLMGSNEVPLPLMGAAIKNGKGDLARNNALAKLIAATDTQKPAWVACTVTDAVKQIAPGLSAFETASIVADRKDDTLTIDGKLTGANAEQVRTGVRELGDAIKSAADEMNQQAAQMKMMQPVADLLASVKLTADGAQATGAASARGALILPVATGEAVQDNAPNGANPPAIPQQQLGQ